MAEYSVVFARSARRELEQLETGLARRVISRIGFGLESRATCTTDLWRIRVGDYHVIYSIDDAAHIVDIRAVRHRSDAHR